MARRIGTGGVSSLVRTASAALDRKLTYDDATRAYEYDTSAKTADDYKTYTDYLSTRAKGVTDPMKQLGLQKTFDSARHTFRSADLTRENQAIMYGQSSLTDKRNLLDRQYQDALNNGDMNLAQQIESQRGSVDIQIQNAADAAAAKAQAAANKASAAGTAAYHRGLNDAITKLKQDETAINNAFRTGDSVIDANGKTVKVTTLNKDQLIGGVLARQAATLQEGIDNTDDPNLQRTLGDQLSSLKGRSEYVSALGGAGKGEALRRGENPYAREWDPNAGVYKQFALKGESHPMVDANGKPIFNTDINGNSTGEQKLTNVYQEGSYKKQNKFVTDYQVGDQTQIDANEVQRDEQGRPFILRLGHDPANPGALVQRKLYVNQGAKNGDVGYSLAPISGAGDAGSKIADFGSGVLNSITTNDNPLISGLVKGVGDVGPNISKIAGGLGKELGNVAKNSPLGFGKSIFDTLTGFGKSVEGAGNASGSIVGKFSRALSNPAGFISNLLGINATKQQDAKNLAALEVKRQAVLAQQNAQRAAEARQASINFANQQAAQRATSVASKKYNPAIANAPANNQVYGKTGGTPAQNAAAVQNSYPNPKSDSAVAAGLGAAAGYNPNWLINPRF